MKLLAWFALFATAAQCVFAFDLTVVSYNVESDKDTDPAKVVQDLQRIPTSHVWGLVEVDSADLETYRDAIDPSYTLIFGNTGFNSGRPDDRLAIVFDPTVLELRGQAEELSAAGGSRHPLLAKFRVISTGGEFWFVVNHLQRGLGDPTNERRQAQADWLDKWAQQKADNVNPPAIVLAGDYNFDVTPYTKRGNPAFEIFMYNGMFRWVEPGCLVDNSCPLTGTGCHDHYNSILDFVFLAGPARHWSATSEMLFLDDVDYCANERLGTSNQMIPGGADHRPIRAVLTF